MFHPLYIRQMLDRIKLLISIVLLLLLLTACEVLIPAQDCGNVPNLSVEGFVIDTSGNPIVGAEITIQSIRQSRCRGAVQFETVTMISSEDGSFNGGIDWISEDEEVAFTVSMSDYQDYERSGTYTILDDALIIELLNE